MHVEDPDTSGILNQGKTGMRRAWVHGRVATTAEVGEIEDSLVQLRKGVQTLEPPGRVPRWQLVIRLDSEQPLTRHLYPVSNATKH